MGTGAAALVLTTVGAGAAGAAEGGTGATPSTLPLASGTGTLGTGTFELFSQADLNFQTLFGIGEAGLNSVCGEVIAVVAAANAAPGGASYQSLFDAFVAQANRLQESALEARAAKHLVTAQSRFIRAAKYYAQALYWVLGTSTPDAEADVYTAMDDMFVAGMKLMKTRPEQIEIAYDGGTLPAWFVKPATTGRASADDHHEQRQRRPERRHAPAGWPRRPRAWLQRGDLRGSRAGFAAVPATTCRSAPTGRT